MCVCGVCVCVFMCVRVCKVATALLGLALGKRRRCYFRSNVPPPIWRWIFHGQRSRNSVVRKQSVSMLFLFRIRSGMSRLVSLPPPASTVPVSISFPLSPPRPSPLPRPSSVLDAPPSSSVLLHPSSDDDGDVSHDRDDGDDADGQRPHGACEPPRKVGRHRSANQ